MCCDYYIIINLFVTHDSQCQTKIEYIELEKMRMYYMFQYDKDVDDYDQLAKEEINHIGEIYKKLDRPLYINHEWVVRNKETITEYIECLKKNNINIDDVVKIEKKHYCMEAM